jgi:hypothetical protein
VTNEELRAYQTAAFATAIYPDAGKGTSLYPYLALCEEAGEVAGLFAKRIRDGERPDFRDKLRKELGDVMWQCAAISTEEGRALYVGSDCFSFINAIRMCSAASRADIGETMARVRRTAEEHGMTLREVADANLAKLAKRAAENKLQGSGSDR